MSDAARVLVVEDDETMREALCDTLQYGGYQTVCACDGKDALLRLDENDIDLVVSDVQMDNMDGKHLLREIKARRPEMPFVVMTAHGSVADAVQAMRDGAIDYLIKPFEAEVLLEMLSRVGSNMANHDEMISADPVMQKVCQLAARIANSDATILISGESGSGKEVLARYIHSLSDRAEQPFVAVNCAAIPENMLESMLFGYEKGAYTGAYQSRPGKFEQANGGTLLLDEISEMDINLQAKLLRVLQEKEVERLGGNKLIPLNVRVLATTNRTLSAEVAEGRFREDLYYRLNVLPLSLPPLRERRDDILPLANRFLQRYAPNNKILKLTDKASAALVEHSWRGNVRELQNCIQRAAILSSNDLVGLEEIIFGDEIQSHQNASEHSRTAAPEAISATAEAQETDDSRLDGDLKVREKELIFEALRATQGIRKDAARRLGISPRTLRYKLAQFRDQGVTLPLVSA